MAAQPVTPELTPAPQAPLSEGARIINTFIAPSKAFTDLRRNAEWWAPFLLIAIVSVGFAYVVDQKVGFRKATENQIQMSPKQAERMDKMPPEDRARVLQQQTVGTRYVSYAIPVVLLILYVIVAGIYLATFKFGANADLKFKTTLAVVVYSALPQVLKTLLAIVSLLAGASADSFTIQNPLASNLGSFMTPGSSPFLYGIASAVDVFLIWSLILTGIGLSCVSKLKRSTALLGVFVWYILMSLFFAALGSL